MKLFFGIAMAVWSLTLMAGAETLYNFHEVSAGETVESIASFYKTSASEIVRSNAQLIKENNGLQPGMILVVPKVQTGAGASASGANAAASGSSSKSSVSASASGASGKGAANKKSAKKAPPKPPSAVSHASTQTTARKSLQSRGAHYRSKPSRPAPSSKPSYRDRPYNAVSYSGGVLRSEENKRPSYSRRKAFTQESKAVSSDGSVAVIPAYVPPPSVAIPGAGSGIVDIACKYMGVPYVWGGSTPDGFDCSGFVQFVYREAGFNIPRTADVQFEVGDEIDCGNEAPGDMVFFETYTQGASHVGIYIGEGEFIHASSRGDVRISSLDEDYFKARYLGARRIY